MSFHQAGLMWVDEPPGGSRCSRRPSGFRPIALSGSAATRLRSHTRRLRDPRVAGIRHAGRAAATSRHLLLLARRIVLRTIRHVAATGHRTYVGNFVACRHDSGWHGGDDPERWAAIAALTALVVAALSVVAWILRLSTLISFISETILLGFKAGAALVISMTQLPKLFGVKGGGENFFERLWTLAGQMGDTNLVVLGLGSPPSGR